VRSIPGIGGRTLGRPDPSRAGGGTTMRLSMPARLARFAMATGLVLSVGAPAAAPVAAADDKVLRIGVLQDLDSTNPYGTILGVGYEAYQLTYEKLVGFGQNIEPIPAFASSWSRSGDGKSWVFKIDPNKKWSDGTPATSADACFSWQLDLDAQKTGDSVGAGYIDYALGPNGSRVTKVECPDPQTMIVYTDDASNRVLQTYIPILPKHIWGKMNYKQIGDDKFDPPADGSGLVGSGPYQAVAWNTGEEIRFKRNPYYSGHHAAEDEIVIRFFKTNESMVQALKAGEIDYAHNISPEQFKQLKSEPNIQVVNGVLNGWTELGFNTYGTGTGKTIKGGGPSTKALLDPEFRDALGYAIDKQKLIDSVIGGLGEIGTTQIPPGMPGVPGHPSWHTEPTNVRTFDLTVADQKLTAAGYVKDASGRRLDKEGKPISLSMVMPDSDTNYAKAGQFITDWFAQLGIKVSPQILDSDTLYARMLPPEGGKEGKADYDLFIWDWSWGPDPNDALDVFRCDEIGVSSDSLWCSPEYDKLYDRQLVAQTPEERQIVLDQMQQMFYDQAPYHILYYNDNLDAYRTDGFGGWQNQPANGVPFLGGFDTWGETQLTDVVVAPSPTAAPTGQAPASGVPSSGGSNPPASGATGTETSSGGVPVLPIALLIVVVVVVAAIFAMRRNAARTSSDDEDE
jgi:peptide/nickel transport system substrate-binding protein